MIQAVIRKGKVVGEIVPTPIVSKGCVLVRVVNSCISSGTELLGVKETRKPILQRALEKPNNVKKVIDSSISEGFSKTFNLVKEKMNEAKSTGYSISGIVIAIGAGVENIEIGDEVAGAGAGYAVHAEIVEIPKNLVVKKPKNVSFQIASTVTLGSIALQGVRRANLNIGEYCVVFGAGILGLITIQMLVAAGVRVIAIDLNKRRLEKATLYGAESTINSAEIDIIETVYNYTDGFGTDVVIFTASTTSSVPLSQSFKMTKKKGRVILVGVCDLSINRDDIYLKELDFQISTSYGPGRYDRLYEENGIDYPYSYVRWTENRNMSEFLRLTSCGKLNITDMIEEVYPIEKVEYAYSRIEEQEKPLVVLLEYEHNTIKETVIKNNKIPLKSNKKNINIAIVGVGEFAKKVHLPNIEKLNPKLKLYAVLNKTGLKAKEIAKQYGAHYATSDFDVILNDENVDLIMITTKHDSHAYYVIESLKKGKNVFVEKPLCTKKEELQEIQEIIDSKDNNSVLFVGYNRRFSKYIKEIRKKTINRINPLFIHYRMNAGYIPLEHWVHDDGGRIVGECCHIIDLITSIIGEKIESVCSTSLSPNTMHFSSQDNKTITLKYNDGSVAIIDYFSTGSNKLEKEYMEVHYDNKSIIMNDYKSIKGYGISVKNINTKQSEKGHLEELNTLYKSIIDGNQKWPIELWDLVQTSEISMLI